MMNDGNIDFNERIHLLLAKSAELQWSINKLIFKIGLAGGIISVLSGTYYTLNYTNISQQFDLPGIESGILFIGLGILALTCIVLLKTHIQSIALNILSAIYIVWYSICLLFVEMGRKDMLGKVSPSLHLCVFLALAILYATSKTRLCFPSGMMNRHVAFISSTLLFIISLIVAYVVPPWSVDLARAGIYGALLLIGMLTSIMLLSVALYNGGKLNDILNASSDFGIILITLAYAIYALGGVVILAPMYIVLAGICSLLLNTSIARWGKLMKLEIYKMKTELNNNLM